MMDSYHSDEQLIRMLEDSDWTNRRYALMELRRQKLVAYANVVHTMLDDPHSSVRLEAIWTLGEFEDKTAIAILNSILGQEASDEIRYAAKWALSKLGDNRFIKLFIEKLNDPYAEVQVDAAEALGSTRDKRALLPLISLLNDHVEYMEARVAAASALGTLGYEEAVDPLIANSDDAEPELRYAIAEALGKLKDSRALPVLRKFKNADTGITIEHKKVSDAATEAIRAIEESVNR